MITVLSTIAKRQVSIKQPKQVLAFKSVAAKSEQFQRC